MADRLAGSLARALAAQRDHVEQSHRLDKFKPVGMLRELFD